MKLFPLQETNKLIESWQVCCSVDFLPGFIQIQLTVPRETHCIKTEQLCMQKFAIFLRQYACTYFLTIPLDDVLI